MPDVNGQTLLRLIIPDKLNCWPEESDHPHNLQILATAALSLYGKIHGHDEECAECDECADECDEN